MDSISDYYAGQVVFVTGGTGFLGKAIIEKILRSCPDVRRVYTLMRSKRATSSADRLDKLKQNEIFGLVRAQNPGAMSKLHGLNGDVTGDNLRLSAHDLEVFRTEVTIVIHSAATVRFNEPIRIALDTNVLGTRRILDMCRTKSNLKSVIYISTAYSNPAQPILEEKVFTTAAFDLDTYVKWADTLTSEATVRILHELHGSFPNTYSLSKHLTEQLVQEYHARYQLPLFIVRPSIVSVAEEQPFPGWTDSLGGIMGGNIALMRGSQGSYNMSGNAIMDLIPLDFVVNCTLAAAWFVDRHPSSRIWVFNCTSGGLNGCSWLRGSGLIVKWARRYPSKYTVFYPTASLRTNDVTHWLLDQVHTLLPAYLGDLAIRASGGKPMLLKVAQKTRESLDACRFFTRNEWTFENHNFVRLLDAVQRTSDHSEFNFDIRKMDWDLHSKNNVLGLSKYLLKVDVGTPRARQMLKRMYIAWLVYYGCIYALIVYALYVFVRLLAA